MLIAIPSCVPPDTPEPPGGGENIYFADEKNVLADENGNLLTDKEGGA